MQGYTHALAGVTAAAALNAQIGFVQPHVIKGVPAGLALCAGFAILGALLPDVDAEDSTIKREFGAAGTLASVSLRLFGVGHRGVTHYGLTTLGVMIVSYLVSARMGYPDAGLALGVGYLSHVVADALTKHGVPLWWPISGNFHLLPGLLRIKTGGAGESIFFMLVSAALAWLVLGMLPPDLLKVLH
jgi:inner membrane protein